MRPHWSVQLLLAVQGVVLALFAVASLIVIFVTEGTVAEVIVFRMNIPHSVLLLIAGVLSGLAALRLRAARSWIVVQAAIFTLLFVIGTAAPSNAPRLSVNRPEDTWLALDRADNLGHLALAVIGVAVALGMAGPWLTGNRVPGRKQTGEESLTSGVGEENRAG